LVEGKLVKDIIDEMYEKYRNVRIKNRKRRDIFYKEFSEKEDAYLQKVKLTYIFNT